MAEVVGEHQIAGKGVGKGLVEVEHLNQLVALDCMQVTVGQSSNVGTGLADGGLLPEGVPEDVALPQDGHHFVLVREKLRNSKDVSSKNVISNYNCCYC